MRKVIVNTTPIIALADIGHLDLLRKIYGQIIIPNAVWQEILSEPAKTLVKDNSDWILVHEIHDNTQKKMYRARLHDGEVEVMILAQEEQADLVILDDNAAKKTAKYLGFTVTGTLGVILKAKREGHIDLVKPLIDDLSSTGFFINEQVIQYVLEEAGEKQ
ncbi:MAG: DUF3368 domain-containing protein [Lachnospiraceae bacterium]|nr:DUF3368 domain-containing protein [Lachnospiraceae bacterium]